MSKFAIILALASVPLWAQGGYSGPQILSRGLGNAGTRAGHGAGFSVFGGILGSYENGIIPVTLDNSGNLVSLDGLLGVQANVGAYGRKSFRRSAVALDYTGNFRHYNSNTYLDGSDHMLSLALTKQMTRRVQFFSRTGAGTLSRYYAEGPASVEQFATPLFGIFDNRAYYLQTATGVQYAPTPRLSFSAAGVGFAVRRQSKSLIGTNGYGAEGIIGYRVNRTRTVEVSYGYNHFDYPRGFGESDVFSYLLGISQQIGRRWQFGVGGGMSQVRTVGLESVAADPVTAALFGNSTVIRAFDRDIKMGAGRASLRGTFRASNVTFTYTQMPNPGNGIYLTSRQSIASASYGYTAIRRASIGFSLTRSSFTSLGQSQLGTYRFFSAGASFSYKLVKQLEALAQYDARDLNIDRTNGFSRLSYRFTFGLTWHPSEFPLSFW